MHCDGTQLFCNVSSQNTSFENPAPFESHVLSESKVNFLMLCILGLFKINRDLLMPVLSLLKLRIKNLSFNCLFIIVNDFYIKYPFV